MVIDKNEKPRWADEVVLDYHSDDYPGFRVVILRLTHSRMYNAKVMLHNDIIDSVRARHDGVEVAHMISDKLQNRIAIQRKKDGSGILK